MSRQCFFEGGGIWVGEKHENNSDYSPLDKEVSGGGGGGTKEYICVQAEQNYHFHVRLEVSIAVENLFHMIPAYTMLLPMHPTF